MKRKVVTGIMVTLLILSMLTLAFNIQLVKTEPSTIIVPDNYSTIQEAINASSLGDTIFARAGTYYEHVVVDKSIQIIGEEPATTIIDGSGTGNVIDVTNTDNVNVTGFTIQNGETGIRLYSSNYDTISNNIILNHTNGIHLTTGSCHNLIVNCSLTKVSNKGIVLGTGCDNNTYENCDASYCVMGFVVAWGHYNLVKNCKAWNCSPDGIRLDSCWYARVENCDVWFNDVGIRIYSWGSARHNTITDCNVFLNNLGIYACDPQSPGGYNKIYHNTLVNNTQHAQNDQYYPNEWDNGHPSGGNYWSNYNGTDFYSGPYQNETGSDGIGDTPYVIDDYNQDNYPLIHPYGSVRNLNTDLVYLTIQSAINSPETLDGHTIFVSSGTYYEKVVMNKTLTIIGEDRSNTIINGSGLNYTGALVTIEADNVDLAGFTVADAFNEGILVESSQHCEVHNNILCFTGDRGIVFGGGGNNTAYNNLVYNSSAYGGIDAIWSNNNTIYNNTVYFNRWGISTNRGSYNRIYNNTVYSNRGSGIHIDWPSTGNLIYNNNISSNTNTGIRVLQEANGTVISGNKISGNFWGIAIENSSSNSISENTITTNRGGISLLLTSNNTLSENDITDNEVGILLNLNSDYNGILGNTLTTSYNNSIVLLQSSMNTISGNTIAHNYHGIEVHSSSNLNTITENTITHNEYGVDIRASTQNKFFHNNFLYNTKQVDTPTLADTNVWDDGYPSGGNYWSDYVGIDFHSGAYQNETGSDEIGDIPYFIDMDNQDNYPLVKAWEVPIIIGTTSRITFLDPAAAYDFCTWEVFQNIGEGLLKYQPGTTELEFGIAENYTVSAGGLNYTFRLRKSLYFTDGQPLDAAAVKWSIDRIMNLTPEPSWIVSLISDYVDTVEVMDNTTVRFILTKAISFFPALVTTTPYFPVSSKSYPENETAESTIGHYGPYRIKSWTKDVELVLEANLDYYGAPPRSKYVIVRFFENATEMRMALEDGEIDIAWRDLQLTDIVEFKESSDFEVVENHNSLIRSVLLRCNMTPFDDARLRRAVAAAVNRTRICTEAYMGTADPLYSLVPMGLWSHIDAFEEEYGVRNLTLARELLNDAGYGYDNEADPDPKFEFELWHVNNQVYADIATITKSDLEATGMMEVTLRSAEWPVYLTNVQAGVMPAFLLGWYADYLDPNAYLTSFVHSESSPELGVFYNNTLMDNVLENATVELNITRRTELYEEAQRLIAEDAPLIPFAQGTLFAVSRPNIEGVYLSPTMVLPYYTIYRHVRSTRYPWSMFRHDFRHTGYTESPAPNTNRTEWNYSTGGSVWSSPAVADGVVFIGSNDGNLYALDQHTGTIIWNYTTGDHVFSSPTVVDNIVYIGSNDTNIYALNVWTGEKIWNYTTGGGVESSPAVADGRVYVGSGDSRVYCLDAVTGDFMWSYSTGAKVFSSPAVADGRVYVGSDNNIMYCLDALTRVLLWNYTTGGWVSSPAVADGKVYFGSFDAKVYCLNASTGAVIWSYLTGGWVESSPAVADGRVYVGSRDAKVYCLPQNDPNGNGIIDPSEVIWICPTGGDVWSSPAVADGKVYFGSFDAKVYCLNASTGAVIWNYTTGDIVYSSPAVADGMVFIGSLDGNVYAFGNIIRVPEDYPTVQEAIDAADPGATIIVAPGIYYESLVINKTVTIIGEPGSVPIFDGGGSGIWVVLLPGASGSTITNVVITNWDQGVFIVNSSNCEIYDNIMSLMGESGIAIEGNTASDNIIYNNIFQGNTIAINLTKSSTNNIIYANTISGNDIGIDMSHSNGTIIYHNNFVDNTVQVYISMPTENIWDNDYPYGGNYWSDYEDKYPGAQEIDDSGIWDTPYEINAVNIDNYPLMKPFSGIRITNVITSKTIIAQGFTLRIDLAILNHGVDNEDSTVTAYADTTIIAKQTMTLTKMNSSVVTFTWNTAGVVYGNYTISAYADPVPGETDTADNIVVDGWVFVTIPGDVNGDGKVRVDDILAVALAFGSNSGDLGYDPNLDINCDDKVRVDDVLIAALNFGLG
ncbi:MAG: PQQ-binding-like beta-propeller repeat protein [Candidatus Bathyarchaeota archaeon]|nr:PQQ-binding-like beta-propeller repeat protein [Candidatus Bathyarchaeota archaeon]